MDNETIYFLVFLIFIFILIRSGKYFKECDDAIRQMEMPNAKNNNQNHRSNNV